MKTEIREQGKYILKRDWIDMFGDSRTILLGCNLLEGTYYYKEIYNSPEELCLTEIKDCVFTKSDLEIIENRFNTNLEDFTVIEINNRQGGAKNDYRHY